MAERLPRHIVDTRDLNTGQLFDVFVESAKMESVFQYGGSNPLEGRRFYLLFYEPSNLTADSFIGAIDVLGGKARDREEAEQSMWQGSSLENQVRRIGNLRYDCLILRGHQYGDAQRAAEVSKIPVISAGEFSGNKHIDFGQHPTQVMTDLYTVYQIHRELKGLNIVIAGDARSNPVVNSLIIATHFFEGINLTVATPSAIASFDPAFEAWLKEEDVNFKRVHKTEEVFKEADVVLIATSLHTNGVEIANQHGGQRFNLTPETLDLLPSHALVLHDMVRGEKPETSSHPKAVWDRQEANHLYTKMALLGMLDYTRE